MLLAIVTVLEIEIKRPSLPPYFLRKCCLANLMWADQRDCRLAVERIDNLLLYSALYHPCLLQLFISIYKDKYAPDCLGAKALSLSSTLSLKKDWEFPVIDSFRTVIRIVKRLDELAEIRIGSLVPRSLL